MILIFVGSVSDKFIFIIMVFVATIIPDLDTKHSSYGRHSIFRPLQVFVKHRGFIHSFTTAVVLSLIIAVFWPVASFGFFIGYSIHLIIDSFTKEGIQPFWPFRWRSEGPIRSGGRFEEIFFFILIGVDVLVFISMMLVW